MRIVVCFIACLFVYSLKSQTLGGNAVFHFLKQTAHAQTASLGGINVSQMSKDLGFVFQNPAQLRSQMHQDLSINFQNLPGGINHYHFSTAYRLEKINTNLAWGVNYVNYGQLTETDASGMILGSLRPNDYVVQIMASRAYQSHFHYGMSLKYIQSNYGQYRANGIAMDLGINYFDEEKGLQLALVVKHLGSQLKTYSTQTSKEELPFDLQLGLSKRLKNAPFQFTLTAHQLHKWNIYYQDTLYQISEGDLGYRSKSTLQKIFAHLVLGTQINLNEQLEFNAGINFLRRQDLNVYQLSSGLNGFSFGLGLKLSKLQFRYATGFYQKNLYHQLSFNLNWKGWLQKDLSSN